MAAAEGRVAEDQVNARLMTLTDGVLSIAMTLLVLDIRLPMPAKDLDNALLWQALAGIWPQVLGYGLSFLVIAALWLSHVRKLRHLRQVNAMLIWLNIGFLLAVGLVPFTTSLLADSNTAAATQLYAGVMGFASLMLGLMSLHAGRQGLIADRAADEQVRAVTFWQFGTAAVFFVSIGIAARNADWAKYFWLLLVVQGLWRRRRAAAG